MKKDISVKGETYHHLQREAKQRGVSVTALVADIVHRFFHGSAAPKVSKKAPASSPPAMPTTF
jgi:hypothetical protein